MVVATIEEEDKAEDSGTSDEELIEGEVPESELHAEKRNTTGNAMTSNFVFIKTFYF
jgi:hypothetical protein